MTVGHEHVKAALVSHLGSNLTTWLDVTRNGDTWPLDPKYVAAVDVLPEKDEQWPCVLVGSSKMTRHLSAESIATGSYVGIYDVTVLVAVRATKERDDASAVQGRDRLLDAVRLLLLTSPGLDDDTAVLLADMTTEADAVAVDVKGRPVGLGRVICQVQHTETIPDPDAVTADTATVDVAATHAAGTLVTNAQYDGTVAYDDPETIYDGGTQWPPKP